MVVTEVWQSFSLGPGNERMEMLTGSIKLARSSACGRKHLLIPGPGLATMRSASIQNVSTHDTGYLQLNQFQWLKIIAITLGLGAAGRADQDGKMQ
jgi:hypothetical protein